FLSSSSSCFLVRAGGKGGGWLVSSTVAASAVVGRKFVRTRHACTTDLMENAVVAARLVNNYLTYVGTPKGE
ncbi:hypothetical protein GWI33_003121, partial [Rhynchophorus ferrugineus]